MPDIKVDDGCTIHAEIEGPERAPVLMLSNSLGTDLHMWDEQAGPLTRHFRLVRYDRRGHGKSDAPKGPYTMERLGRDVLGVLDGLGIRKINWCGLSMGGMVGMWLGANAGTASTSSSSPTPPRISPTRQSGMPASRWCATSDLQALSIRTWSAGLPRAFANTRRKPWPRCARCSSPPISRATSAAAKRSATWIIARYCR